MLKKTAVILLTLWGSLHVTAMTIKEDLPPLENSRLVSHFFLAKKGLCIYLTGLSGAGKSTLAEALKKRIEASDPFQRPVVILDGDEVRKFLSSELGFSKKDRSLNVRRIGYVASLLVNSGTICICANIAPYEEDRRANRELIASKGAYFEVFVDTALAVCEKRDVKGLYKKAREGLIKEFTGISDPYEIPQHADLTVDGGGDLEENIEKILETLQRLYGNCFDLSF